jgi:hypothetical protein
VSVTVRATTPSAAARETSSNPRTRLNPQIAWVSASRENRASVVTARADFSPGAIDPLSRVRAPALDAGICEIRERAAERPGFASLWGPRTRRFDRSKRWRLTLRQKVPPGPAGLHRPRIYQWSARRARRAEFEKLHRSLRHGCGSRRCYGNRILERQDKIVSIAGIGAQAERARIGAAGLSHLILGATREQAGEEAVVPPGPLQLAFH